MTSTHRSSWKDLSRLMVYLELIFILIPTDTTGVPISIQKVNTVETSNNTIVYERLPLLPPDSVCRYKAQSYLAGDEVPTDEPCLRCQCKKQAVVCKLRICTETVPDAPPPGCVVVQKAKSCCPKLVCPETKKITREQRLSTGTMHNTTVAGIPLRTGQGFCSHEGTIYAEGSAMRSNSPCDYCFCIRGQMKCSSPQCVLPLKGCQPLYRSFACCPTNYDCTESNTTAILQTTVHTTSIPPFLKGCRLGGRFIYEGEPIFPMHLEPQKDSVCQTCFCLGGTVRCRPLECARPLDGCHPVTPDGHCCPSRYDCPVLDNPTTTSLLEKVENVLSLSPDPTTTSQPRPIEEGDLVQKGSPTPRIFEMTTTYPLSSLSFESDLLSNKLRSDSGSREERQNRDRDQDEIKPSYEDDEKDYLFGVPSLETIDHDLILKVAFDHPGERRSTVKSLKALPTVVEDRTENEIVETSTTGTPGSIEGNLTISNSINSNHHSDSKQGTESNLLEKSTTETNFQTVLPPVPGSVGNLHFIPFSVEDALVLRPISNNQTNLPTIETHLAAGLPMQITFDPETIARSSLIPPLYPVTNQKPISLIPTPHHLDSYRNVIMDVPVSTSLYNNGYYHNGLLVNSHQDSNPSFPGQLFEDAEEVTETEEKVGPASVPMTSTISSTTINLSRTYSKFEVDDHRTQVRPERVGNKTHAESHTDDPDPLYEEDDKSLESFDTLEPHSNEFQKTIPFSELIKTEKPIRITTNSKSQGGPSYRHKDSGTTGSQSLKPVVAFPFKITSAQPKQPTTLGLKLSGCNIYGKMYKVGHSIRELSGPCVQCRCTDIGVQCTEEPC